MYRIEIRNSAGDLLQILKNYFEASLEESINAPTALTFFMPSTDPQLYYISKGNEIWVRNTETDEVLAKTKLILQEDEK